MPPISAATIHGKLSAPETLHGKLSGATLKGRINVSNGYSVYTGDTVVIPKADSETVLGTAGKVVLENVTVRKVPYFETGNESGYTAYIASEV